MNIERRVLDDTPRPHGEDDPRPLVALPRAGLPGAAIAAIALILAVLLFAVLNSRRESAQSPQLAPPDLSTFASPPPLTIPPAPAPQQPAATAEISPPVTAPAEQAYRPPAALPMPPPVVSIMPAPSPPMVAPPLAEISQKPPALDEPALVIDLGAPPVPVTGANGAKQDPNDPNPAARPGASVGTAPISPIRVIPAGSRTSLMPTGTLIKAVLETPIDTSRPGLVRALVSRDARGFDGKRVLIPRGSRVVGDYQSDVQSGQKRVLVTWTRLIRPDGSVVPLESPSADALGGAGVPGKVNSFFLERFFSSAFQTAVSVGANLATWSHRAPVIVGVPNPAATNVVGQLGQSSGPHRKITVKAGTEFNIFVARDVDFAGASSGR